VGSLEAFEKLQEHIRALFKNRERFAHSFENSNEVQTLEEY